MILSQKEKIGVIFFIEKIPNLGGEFEGGLAKYQTFYCILLTPFPKVVREKLILCLSSTTNFEAFLCRLESLVSACRAPELAIKVMAERKRKYTKVSGHWPGDRILGKCAK